MPFRASVSSLRALVFFEVSAARDKQSHGSVADERVSCELERSRRAIPSAGGHPTSVGVWPLKVDHDRQIIRQMVALHFTHEARKLPIWSTAWATWTVPLQKYACEMDRLLLEAKSRNFLFLCKKKKYTELNDIFFAAMCYNSINRYINRFDRIEGGAYLLQRWLTLGFLCEFAEKKDFKTTQRHLKSKVVFSTLAVLLSMPSCLCVFVWRVFFQWPPQLFSSLNLPLLIFLCRFNSISVCFASGQNCDSCQQKQKAHGKKKHLMLAGNFTVITQTHTIRHLTPRLTVYLCWHCRSCGKRFFFFFSDEQP